MGYACAIGVMLFLLILVLTILNLRYFRTSEQLTGND
jgi:ABC-type sugar transport system permease subunit